MKSKMLKTIASVALLLAMVLPAFGQTAAPTEPQPTFMDTHQTEVMIGLFVTTMLIMIFVVVYLSSLLVSMTKSVLTQQQQDALEDVEFIPFSKLANWAKLSKALNDSVPIEQEAEIMLDHDYDGIKELDNHLPPWWTAMFYATIVFGIVYLFYYQFSDTDRSQLAEYEQDMAIAQEQKDAYLAKMANLVNENNVTALTDAGSLGNGKTIYIQYCAACHGQAGEGGVGPNFADANWIHGGGITNVFKTVKYGVPEKGMISWQDQMTAKDMQDVASYILTLQGTNPPNPKAPQGDIWSETGSLPAANDSTLLPNDSTQTVVDTIVQTTSL